MTRSVDLAVDWDIVREEIAGRNAIRRRRPIVPGASLLDDKVLDATVEHSQVAFTIADQLEE